MKFSSLIALVPVVAAHFTLDYPPTRGFDDDNEVKAICGTCIGLYPTFD